MDQSSPDYYVEETQRSLEDSRKYAHLWDGLFCCVTYKQLKYSSFFNVKNMQESVSEMVTPMFGDEL